MIVRFSLLGCAMMLAGCQTTDGPASISGGECRIFERPEYVVLGKRQYDQDWIDSQIEGGVGGCRWQRPQPRPVSLDAVPGQKAAPVVKKKRGVIRRGVRRVLKTIASPFVAPVAPVVMVPPLPAPRPAPRDAVDELLQPSD